ncbi:TPM domain-containing protein [Longibacter sp.]|uniref:TPM domain-containing protein n=1 Tax=Longibacter sp. TaxID=2045415 RepID=UPI003EBD3B84
MKTLIENLDREKIAAAVSDAENRTAGEIVPYVVPRSDRYEIAVWRGASAVALLSVTVVLLIVQFYQGWGLGWLFTPWAVAMVSLLGGVGGAILGAYVGPIQRALAGSDVLDLTVHRAAMQAFVEEEVFSTRDRTGILLFVSLHEHRIEVLGDTGINAKVSEDEWIDVVHRIRTGIANRNLTAGLVDAIEMCGKMLERRGVDIRPDDENELPDSIRTPGFGPSTEEGSSEGHDT